MAGSDRHGVHHQRRPADNVHDGCRNLHGRSKRSLGANLGRHPGAEVAVEGHTDDTGTEGANLAISRLRAEAVRRLLVEGGVSAAAVTATGRGETSPVADNGTREGRARNRRVEVSVRLAPAGS